MHCLQPAMISALTSSLLRQQSDPELYLPEIQKPKNPKASGVCFLLKSIQTQTSRIWLNLSLSFNPSECNGEMNTLRLSVSQTKLAEWRTLLSLSARCLPQWEPMTHV